MTNKEAIEILSERYLIPVDDGVDEFCEKVNKALGMAIAALNENREPIGEWIPMWEQMPMDMQTCWVSNGEYVDEDTFYAKDRGRMFGSNIYEGERESDGWWEHGTEDEDQRVTHWMPMPDPMPPEPPKGEER